MPAGRPPKKKYAFTAKGQFAPLACDDVNLLDVERAEHLAYQADAEFTDADQDSELTGRAADGTSDRSTRRRKLKERWRGQKSIRSFFSPIRELLPVPTTDFPVLPALAEDESGAIGTGLSPMDFVIDLGFESDCGKSREGAEHTNALADWIGGDDMSRVDLGPACEESSASEGMVFGYADGESSSGYSDWSDDAAGASDMEQQQQQQQQQQQREQKDQDRGQEQQQTPAVNKNPAPATRQAASSKPAPCYFEPPRYRPTGLSGGSGRPTRRPESWTNETFPNRRNKKDRRGWMARKAALRKENQKAARVARLAHREKVYLEASLALHEPRCTGTGSGTRSPKLEVSLSLEQQDTDHHPEAALSLGQDPEGQPGATLTRSTETSTRQGGEEELKSWRSKVAKLERDRTELLVKACGIISVKLEQQQSGPSYGYDCREGGGGGGGRSGCSVGDEVRLEKLRAERLERELADTKLAVSINNAASTGMKQKAV